MGKSTRHPKPAEGSTCVAPHIAIYGARNEAMAFTNCPKVSVEDRLPVTMFDTKGFSEVCMRALPIPKSENATNIRG